MKPIIAVFFISFLASHCLAQQQIYISEEQHFSFIPPEGWELISKDEIPSRYEMMAKRLIIRQTRIEAVLYPENNSQDAIFPCIIIEAKIFEHTHSKEAEKDAKEEVERANQSDDVGKGIKSLFFFLKGDSVLVPRSWKGAKKIDSEVYYDAKRHILFDMVTLSNKEDREIVVAIVKLLGDRRMITLTCFWDGEDSQDFIDLLNEFVDSFSYDEGYGFGENSIVSKLVQKSVGNTWESWVIWIIGGMVVSWLIRRWVAS